MQVPRILEGLYSYKFSRYNYFFYIGPLYPTLLKPPTAARCGTGDRTPTSWSSRAPATTGPLPSSLQDTTVGDWVDVLLQNLKIKSCSRYIHYCKKFLLAWLTKKFHAPAVCSISSLLPILSSLFTS
jgi:hypothetical protein